MRHLADWLAGLLGDVRVEFLPAGATRSIGYRGPSSEPLPRLPGTDTMAIGVSRAGRGRAGSSLWAAMSCRGTFAAVFVLLLPASARAEVVSGRVFLDADRNGRFDRGEGLAGVPVSDGVAFTRTDANGLYRIDAKLHELLPPDKGPILTVSFPSGTWPARGWFRRVPRAARPRPVDFPLRPDAQKLPFVFVHRPARAARRQGQVPRLPR